MIDITKPLQTRDGRRAEVIRGPDGCLYGWVEDMVAEGNVASIWRFPDGRIEPHGDSPRDIINVPERRTLPDMWINVFADPDRRPEVHYSSSDAYWRSRIACVHLTGIKYTAGEGLDEDEPPTEASAP